MSKLPVLEAQTSASVSGPSSGAADAELVTVFQDSGKKAIIPKGPHSEWVERLRKANAFEGNIGTVQFVRLATDSAGSTQSVLFLGAGNPADLTEERLRVAGGNAWARLKAEKVQSVAVLVDRFLEQKKIKVDGGGPARWIRALAEGLTLNAYQFDKYKSQSESKNDYYGPNRIVFQTHDKGLKARLAAELVQVRQAAEAIQVTRDWSNEPTNVGTPEYYANEAKKLAHSYGLKCRILDEKEARREGMGLFLGVGQGSARESQLVVVEYSPKNVKSAKTVAMVGKGITFDTGGISIKAAMRMEEMKHDMTGAATVMGATLLAAKWGAPHRIVTAMAFAENMPDGNAITPGNILTGRNGKTVEIINTDAEGRLVLADALDYVQDWKPDVVIDAATLTGAISIALGKYCCGVFGNDEDLIEALRRAGEKNGERLWQLPLYDEYLDDMKSEVADLKNAANDGNGGSIRAAAFLKQFIRKNVSWAHLDIAATAYNVGHLSYFPKRGANGAFVRTLAQFVMDF